MVNLITAIRNDDFKTIEKWLKQYPSVIQKHQQEIYDHICDSWYNWRNKNCKERAQLVIHWINICPFLITYEKWYYRMRKKLKDAWFLIAPMLIRKGVKYPVKILCGGLYFGYDPKLSDESKTIILALMEHDYDIQKLANYCLRNDADIIGCIPNDKRLSIDDSNVERVCKKQNYKWDATLKNLVHHGVILTQKHINMCIQSRNLTRVEYCKAVVHLQAIYIALETYTTIPHIIQRIIAKFYGPRNIDIEIPLPVRQETNKKRKCVII